MQTTTARGRLQIADPDLGYDTLDGGTNLHAQLATNFTAFSDHLVGRYYSYASIANTVTKTITHNFGLALSKIKIVIFEGGSQLSEATIASHYTISQTDTNTITVQNSSGGTLSTVVVLVLSMRLNCTSADFDANVSITTTGTITSAVLQTTGNDLVLNSGASESGASWKSTIHRPTSGMTADATITLPIATSTLATLGLAETLDSKTLTSVAAITLVATAAINWAAGNVAIGASIGANTMTLGGSTSTVRVAGAASCLTFSTDSNDLVVNNAAAGSGADWKGTFRRPSSGMSSAAIWTMPIATTTIMGRDTTDTMTNKTATAMAVTGGSYINLLTQAAIRFNDSSTNYVAMKAASSVTTYTITLPAAVPSANQVLADAGAGDGALGWVTVASSSLSQYNVDVGNSSNARTAVNTNLLGDVTGSAISQSYTVTNAAPGVFTVASAPATGDSAYVTVTQNGFTANTRYYVTNIDATTFKLATTLSNAIAGVNITSSGTTAGTIITGGLTLNSTIPIRGSIVNADGSVSAPSYSFSSDTNTGMFRLGTDNLALVTGGVTRMQFTSAGYTWLGGGANQPYTLDVTNGIADWLVHLSNTTVNGGLLLLDITDSAEIVRVRGSASPAIQLYGDGTAKKVGGGSWTATSDKRAKKNITDFKDGLDVAIALNPITFQYNGLYETTDDGKSYNGLVAQDVEKIAPYMVKDVMTPKGNSKSKEDTEKVAVKNMDPSALTYILLNAVKELKTKNDALESRIKGLETK